MKNQIINYYRRKEIPLTSYDIIGSKCWIQPTYQTKVPEQKMVQLTNHYYLNRYFLKYIENSSLVDTTIHEPIEVNGVQLEGGFDIRGIWHQFTPVSSGLENACIVSLKCFYSVSTYILKLLKILTRV